VPVRMYSAISEHKLHFHYLHKKDDSPIGYQKVCKKEDKPVPDKEIVKAFEYERGEYVHMEDEDFEAAQVEGHKTIDITDFVPYADIDPIYFAKTYYLGPQEGADKVYSLLVRAMEDSELAGVAKFIMRDRQYLGCLRVREGIVALEQLYFADEIRPIDEIKPRKSSVGKQELAMAAKLIESFTSEFRPEKYTDTYRDELCAVIKAKRKGREVHRAERQDGEEAPDLLSALRASVEQARGGKPSRPAGRSPGSTNGELEELSKEELQERAKKAKVPGRSKMSKQDLVEALSDAA